MWVDVVAAHNKDDVWFTCKIGRSHNTKIKKAIGILKQILSIINIHLCTQEKTLTVTYGHNYTQLTRNRKHIDMNLVLNGLTPV